MIYPFGLHRVRFSTRYSHISVLAKQQLHYLSGRVVFELFRSSVSAATIQACEKQPGTNALLSSADVDTDIFRDFRRCELAQTCFLSKPFHSLGLRAAAAAVSPSDRCGIIAYSVAHPLFQWENQFICTGRDPGGPELINFSA